MGQVLERCRIVLKNESNLLTMFLTLYYTRQMNANDSVAISPFDRLYSSLRTFATNLDIQCLLLYIISHLVYWGAYGGDYYQ